MNWKPFQDDVAFSFFGPARDVSRRRALGTGSTELLPDLSDRRLGFLVHSSFLTSTSKAMHDVNERYDSCSLFSLIESARQAVLLPSLGCLLLAAAVLAAGPASAQSFEDGKPDPWNFSDDFYSTLGEITDERASDGTYSAKITLRSTGNNKAAFRTFPSDITLSQGDVLQFWVYVASDQTEDITALKPLIEYGPDFSNSTFDSAYYTPPGTGGDEFETDEWHTLTYEVPAGVDGENLLTAGIELEGTADDVSPTIYVDDITFAGNPLPVELVAFDVVTDGDDAILKWKTASETNNAGFAVLHTAPGAESAQEVAFVDGVGTTNRAQSYTYSVGNLSPGTHRFQLRQADLDGTTTLLDPVTAEITAGETSLTLVGANPFSQATQVRYSVTTSGPVQVTLYDVMGRKVRTVFEGAHAQEATRTLSVDGSDLSSGVYFLRLTTETEMETKRLTVVE